MSRTFAYCRVSTDGQNTSNQLLEIAAAGFAVEPYRAFEEVISGSVQAKQRPGWRKLVERLESTDMLVVTKLDRLGRNAIDVRNTVDELAERGIKVHCLALGGVDLTSAAGRMTMQVLSAVAEFERDLLIERTQAGLERAKSEGKKLGRPAATKTREKVQGLKEMKFSQAQVAAKLGVSLPTVKRHWK